MATVLVTGKTFPVKKALKALGGRWDARARGWLVPAEKAAEARALVDLAGGPRRARSTRTTFFGDHGGVDVFTNVNGRCEDAPCCGCCS